jgi:hypothetical protein
LLIWNISFVFGDLDRPMEGWYATSGGSQGKALHWMRDLVPLTAIPLGSMEQTVSKRFWAALGGCKAFCSAKYHPSAKDIPEPLGSLLKRIHRRCAQLRSCFVTCNHGNHSNRISGQALATLSVLFMVAQQRQLMISDMTAMTTVITMLTFLLVIQPS